jgi:glycosyltransferase involved in cell wall biosynthesis
MTADRPVILLLADANSTSLGAERHVVDLIARLPSEGFRVVLGCPAGGDLASLAESMGLAVHPLPFDKNPSTATLRAVRSAIARVGPNVIHCHGSRSATYARLCDPLSARRVVCTVHGIHAGRGASLRRTLLTFVEPVLRRRTACFITVCNADATAGARLRILTPSRTSTIHNGIQLPLPEKPRGKFRKELSIDERPLVLSVGRFHPQKDHMTLVEAWRIVSRSRPDAVLALMGAGPLEDKVRAAVHRMGLSPNVHLVSPRKEVGEAYADADVFALSSRSEGLPYVVLEAMAHGLPVVGTSVGGVPEAVDDGVTGLLVPSRDPLALSAAILRLLSHPDQARQCGSTGRTKVARDFTLQRMVAQLTDVYRRCMRIPA